jgi:hypothetical protein
MHTQFSADFGNDLLFLGDRFGPFVLFKQLVYQCKDLGKNRYPGKVAEAILLCSAQRNSKCLTTVHVGQDLIADGLGMG